MSGGKLISMNKNGQQSQPDMKMNLDVTKLNTITCDNCGGKFFTEAILFKEVPAVQSPTGQKSVLPIPVVRCADCGELHGGLNPKEIL